MIFATLCESLLWRPPVSPLWVWLGGAALLILTLRSHWASGSTKAVASIMALSLRLIAIVALAVFCLGPAHPMSLRKSDPSTPELAVLVDTSGSMQTTDCGGQSRLAHLAEHWLSASQRNALTQRFALRWFRFDRTVSQSDPVDLVSGGGAVGIGEKTHLYDAIEKIASRLGADGVGGDVVVMSDGHDSTESSFDAAIGLAQARGVRIHTLTVGGQAMPPNVALDLTPPTKSVAVGTRGTLGVTLHPVGLDTATLVVRHLAPNRGESVLQVPVNGRRLIDVWLPIEPKQPGDSEHAVTVEWPTPGAASGGGSSGAGGGVPGRATASALIRATDRPLRVAMIETRPDWDSRFLADALRRDAGITLSVFSNWRRDGVTSVIREMDDAFTDDASGPGDWRSFDAVIVIGDTRDLLDSPAADRLVEYVQRHGGALLWAGAPVHAASSADHRTAIDRLHSLNPFVTTAASPSAPQTSAVKLFFSRRGRPLFGDIENAQKWSDLMTLPSGATLTDPVAIKPAASVLLATDEPNGLPVVAVMPSGSGIVGAVTARGLWRWCLSPAGEPDRRGLYELLWGNLIRYLVNHGDWDPGAALRLEIAEPNFVLGQEQRISVIARIASADMPAPTVTLMDSQDQPSSVALSPEGHSPGRWSAAIHPAMAGTYRVLLDSAPAGSARQEMRFIARDPSTERIDVAARPDVMTEMATRTGGIVLRDEDAAIWPQLIVSQSADVGSDSGNIELAPAWAHPGALALVLACLIGEWALRRQLDWM